MIAKGFKESISLRVLIEIGKRMRSLREPEKQESDILKSRDIKNFVPWKEFEKSERIRPLV